MLELISFPDTARIWIFQGDKKVPDDKVNAVHYRIQEFTEAWTSHQNALTANGGILHQRFIIFVVDESKAGASGCSIDKAVHFVQSLGHHLQIDFFNRNRYSYIIDDDVYNVSPQEMKDLFNNGDITDETFVFDNLVNNKSDFINKWTTPFGDSWVKKVVLR